MPKFLGISFLAQLKSTHWKREKYKSTKPLLRGEMGQGLDKQAGIQS